MRINHIQPHNIEFEAATLASCILHQEDLEQFSCYLGPEHFYRTGHQKIFKVCLDLFEKGKRADLPTVCEALTVCSVEKTR